MAEQAPRKAQKTKNYVLYYWPGIPGRGEFIRLAFEQSGHSYTEMNDPPKMMKTLASGPLPHFACPALELPSGQFISQTSNILNYLAPHLKLAGEKGNKLIGEEAKGLSEQQREEGEVERAVVNQLVLTILDLTVEAHDTHHPIASGLYYEDQKTESIRRAADFRKTRLPKFFNYFKSVLCSNPSSPDDDKSYLVGKNTTTADLALFHTLTGLEFAFPKRIQKLKDSGEYDVLWKLKERVEKKEAGISAYLESGRRDPFSQGIFRHYPELDGDE